MTEILRKTLAPPETPLSPGFPGLLVHTGVTHAAATAGVCAAEGLGAVISVGSRRQARAAVRGLLDAHELHLAARHHVMFDAEAYAGQNRARGAAPIESAWVRMQWAAGCEWALTNSGYIGEDDTDAFDAVLRAGADIGGRTVTALAIHASWLQRRAREMAQKIDAAGQPVAIMVEHSSDPFGVRATVRGLVAVLDFIEVPVLLLRSDLSALGAVAFGASSGAIGTTTTRRHIWPIRNGGGSRSPSIAALVPALMDFNRLSKINDAILYGADPIWQCMCDTCYGRTLDWILTAEEAFTHSLRAVATIADAVFDPALDVVQRRHAWISRCQAAQVRHFEASDLARTEWKAPQFLGQWVALAPEIATP